MWWLPLGLLGLGLVFQVVVLALLPELAPLIPLPPALMPSSPVLALLPSALSLVLPAPTVLLVCPSPTLLRLALLLLSPELVPLPLHALPLLPLLPP